MNHGRRLETRRSQPRREEKRGNGERRIKKGGGESMNKKEKENSTIQANREQRHKRKHRLDCESRREWVRGRGRGRVGRRDGGRRWRALSPRM
ncbi:hypothetical protein IE53DRAFT_138484 [Violaceomyces palustris]|uniref:Uncharacterized protein n=1 Tax=Violaceomyces palustris TaxID=1673888 RepID=A0ACD0NUS6_9BASI|nr:hypothetical protein IE53DRAFT_138484 [Violaceomyces palustris]